MDTKTYSCILLLCILSVAVLLKSCDRGGESSLPVIPSGTEAYELLVTLTNSAAPNAKALSITITAEGLNEQGEPAGPSIDPLVIEHPVFPLNALMTLYRRPCYYRISVTAGLMREPARTRSALVDICQSESGGLAIDTYEDVQMEALVIEAPSSVNAGETIMVACSTRQLSAPDIDLYPLSANLEETDGSSISGGIDNTSSIFGEFPDPYPVSALSATKRTFTCSVSDGHSSTYTASRTIQRIPPAPTATPNPTSTATPNPTPTSPSKPTPTPTPTPTPIPLCLVTNNNDSGAGSLRQVLADASSNGCSTITFASGVSTINLSSQLNVTSGTLTIDGGSGVTLNGGNSDRVFYVHSTVNLTLENLTMTQGRGWYPGGGAIYIIGGTVTIESGSTITNSTANDYGGGIYNDSGTVYVNGTISNNIISVNTGGGIYNDGGRIYVNGLISNNEAPSGGGIYNEWGEVYVNGSIRDNRANSGAGGGIYSDGGWIWIENGGVVRGNEASNGGGGIVCGVALYLNDGVIENNTTSTGNGGGIYNIFNGTITFGSNNLLQNNTATSGTGGGIYNSTGGTINGTPDYGSGNTPDDCDGPGGCP